MIYESEPFTVQEGEEVQILPIDLKKQKKEQKGVTEGVLLKNGIPAENYIIKVFKLTPKGTKIFVGFTFTDSFGRFLIPLPSDQNEYIIKVYSLKEETDNLDLQITPHK